MPLVSGLIISSYIKFNGAESLDGSGLVPLPDSTALKNTVPLTKEELIGKGLATEEENIAKGKLSQAMAFGAKIIAINGSFDDALNIVRKLEDYDKIEIVNSINPYRIEGQKSAAFEILDDIFKKIKKCENREENIYNLLDTKEAVTGLRGK